jgi:predicted amidohydrolase
MTVEQNPRIPPHDRVALALIQIVPRGHAIANGVFVAAINRVGKEDDIQFWGQSFVADPSGRVCDQVLWLADGIAG